MPGFGGYTTVKKLSPSGSQQQQPGASQSLSNYGTPLSQASQNMMAQTAVPNPNIYQGQDANYIRNIATAYTPQQMAQMKTAATNVQAAGNRGMTDRIRELMAAQGLSGSGAETGAMTNAMVKSNANLANTMSGIDIANAQTDLANQYSKAGLLNQLMGIGLNENQQAIGMDQFNKGLYSDLYKWGNQFDWQKYLDRTANQKYDNQFDMMLKMLGMGGGGGSGYGGYPVNRAG